MLVTRKDISFISTLARTKDLVAIDSIPKAFKKDFDYFFFGKTLTKKDNALFAYPHDIKAWIKFIYEKYND